MRWKGKLLGMERIYVYMVHKFVTRERTLSDRSYQGNSLLIKIACFQH
jgi:hypothetical protein